MEGEQEIVDIPGASPMDKPRGRALGWFGGVILQVLLCVAVSAGSIYFYDQHYAQKVVSYDLPGYLKSKRELLVSGQEGIDQVMAELDATLKAVPPHHVVILKEVAVRNVPEIETPK